jgi:hypothetical protein
MVLSGFRYQFQDMVGIVRQFTRMVLNREKGHISAILHRKINFNQKLKKPNKRPEN